jgi:ferrous iron transport protein B
MSEIPLSAVAPCHAVDSAAAAGSPTVLLIGNPNTGKTSLFNRLTGLRAKTANFAGTTLERRVGTMQLGGRKVHVEDLPGLYALHSANAEERIAQDSLRGAAGSPAPAGAVVVVDATNLARNLYLVSQVRQLEVPVVVALNMTDLAEREGVRVDAAALSRELGAPVVPVSARTGDGLAALREALAGLVEGRAPRPALPVRLSACGSCGGCAASSERFDWAEDVAAVASRGAPRMSAQRTARLDRVLTHPVAGLAVFAALMAALFITLFAAAEYPMGAIETGVSALGSWVGARLPEGELQSFLVDGVITGVGGVLVFLPQIAILFFFLSLLDDSGYLARAAFVMDRLMGKVGLPGKAFVPMLSAHACAIPALMSTRVIEDRRDRLATMLVIPLLTCSARLPVYAMVVALLFAGRPVQGGLLFTAAYALGVVAALGVAWLLRRTLLRGESRPLVIELPTYKMPSLRNALLAMRDRGGVFLRKAGTAILLISIGMWALSTYPGLSEERAADALASGGEARLASARLENSMAGRIGQAIEPVFRPLGFDWRIDIGVLSSFAARETLVSTLAVVYGVGDDEAASEGLRDTMRAQRRADGAPVFGLATSCSLLVFFVLAMQCLPTQAVMRRESGSWRWAAFQFGYMTVLAYAAALVTYQGLRLLGVG